MNILILGPERDSFNQFFSNRNDRITYFEDKLEWNTQMLNSIDFIISYGFRHLITEDVINHYYHRIINLHISFLPWNKGADPNLWSFLEDTPKGVTIHYVDTGFDTGELIVKKEIQIYKDDTLETTYNRLSKTIERLLFDNWEKIIEGTIKSIPQEKNIGSFHKSKDKNQYLHLLTKGWKTPIIDLIGKAKK